MQTYDSAVVKLWSSLQIRDSVNNLFLPCLFIRRVSYYCNGIPMSVVELIELKQIGGLLLFFCRVIGDANSVGLSALSFKLVLWLRFHPSLLGKRSWSNFHEKISEIRMFYTLLYMYTTYERSDYFAHKFNAVYCKTVESREDALSVHFVCRKQCKNHRKIL